MRGTPRRTSLHTKGGEGGGNSAVDRRMRIRGNLLRTHLQRSPPSSSRQPLQCRARLTSCLSANKVGGAR